MRPGWRLDKSGPFPVWRWGAPIYKGRGPWLTVVPGHVCGHRWKRIFADRDGRPCSRTGDCDDPALAMACAEVRQGRADESPEVAGQARVRESRRGRWLVEEFGGLWVEIADPQDTSGAATLAAARLLLAVPHE